MQILNASPREEFSVAQIQELLTGDYITYTAGLELLDTNNALVSDISDNLVSGEIDRLNSNLIHGTCKLRIEGALSWGRDRVRPYLTVGNGVISARFNLGVFVLTTPDSARGEDPVIYDVTGFDLLYLLQSSLSDTYVVPAGTTYLSAIQDIITASGITGTVHLDGTLQSATLPETMVWALDQTSSITWLEIINTLLASINYIKLWVDENGIFQSSPYIAPLDRAIEWTFDTSDVSQNIVAPSRKLSSDVWGAHNWWRFVRKGMTEQPVEGAGIYTVSNPSSGVTSIATIGRTVKAPVRFLEASDQTSLVAQGDKIVAAELAVSRSFDISIDALPVAGHWDIVNYIDEGMTDKCRVLGWAIPLDGSPGRWQLESVAQEIVASAVPLPPIIGAAVDSGVGRAYNNGKAIISFAHDYSGDAADSYTATSSPGGFTGTSTGGPITVTGLQSGVAYTFTVKATNSFGDSSASAASNSITATTIPQAPTIGTATVAGNHSASVAFTANGTGGLANTFSVASTPAIGAGSSSATPVVATGLAAATAYTFKVTATNANGSSAASSASNSITTTGTLVTGGTLYSDGTYYYRKFLANDTLGITGAALSCDVLLIAAGGASGHTSGIDGGGGAGELLFSPGQSFSSNQTVVIGAGVSNSNGQDSTLGSLTAKGGGKGGDYGISSGNGSTGGSSGGGAGPAGTSPAPTGGTGVHAGANAPSGVAGGGGGGSKTAATGSNGGDGDYDYSAWASVTESGVSGRFAAGAASPSGGTHGLGFGAQGSAGITAGGSIGIQGIAIVRYLISAA